MSLGWVAVDKSSGAPKVVRKVDKIQDAVKDHLQEIASGKEIVDTHLKQEYKKRKLIQEMYVMSYYKIQYLFSCHCLLMNLSFCNLQHCEKL